MHQIFTDLGELVGIPDNLFAEGIVREIDSYLRQFSADHLPSPAAAASRPFGDLARAVASKMTSTWPVASLVQTRDCLKHLCAAKDAAVRAIVAENRTS